MSEAGGVRRIGQSHQPLREVVAGELREAILSGRLRPGERLVEDRLAEDLGVSRNPVREALRILASEGLIEIAARRGASVANLSPDEGEHLFVIREPLEALAAQLAAQRVTEPELADLRVILDKGVAASADPDTENLPTLNTMFHRTVVQLAGNPYLAQFVDSLRDRIQWVYAGDVRSRGADSWAEHREIYEAIAAHDPQRAAAAAARHISRARDAFMTRDGKAPRE